jgi:hypothetical protein
MHDPDGKLHIQESTGIVCSVSVAVRLGSVLEARCFGTAGWAALTDEPLCCSIKWDKNIPTGNSVSMANLLISPKAEKHKSGG